MKVNPLISVIMPVYNAGEFLVGTLESIRKQTYKNIELIIINDGSTDDSLKIIRKYRTKFKRSKIRLYNYKLRRGPAAAISIALSKARGEYIARMDADDIAAPTRFADQMKYLVKNPEAVAVGGQCKIINKTGKIIGNKFFPNEMSRVDLYLSKLFTFQRTTLMITRKKIPKDFIEIDSHSMLARYGKIGNLSNVILYSRIHNKNAFLKDSPISFLRKAAIYNFEPTKRKTTLKLRYN